ncbi:hypothetical protein FQ085_05110 [Planococcus sp. ANT_H30]|uniref:YtxH domain-containing protein n=1 Tax=Planococcus kocurii TaxID=1374 RepID=A0ABM5WTG5_9BACL|nr:MULTISPECIES: hypothetical protein [Planococcus]ALS77516.1 hypothetical protein AUO94_02150 [Planococcus kocurii]KAA0959101.1 hypothetical protein FQ085_05110 [Planococcus sp. ANT_H30]
MARKSSGGVFGKLVLIGLGALIGSAMTQQKTGTSGTSQTSKADMKANIKKGLDRLNEQSGGMVDKVKPTVNKAVEKVKTAIDAQQDMMNKEKDALDKANKTLQDEVGKNADKRTHSTTDKTDTSSTESVSPNTNKPTGGIYGGSTKYTESLKKGVSNDSEKKNDSTFGKDNSSSNTKETFGGSTEYTDSLKKNLSENSSKKDNLPKDDSTFGK